MVLGNAIAPREWCINPPAAAFQEFLRVFSISLTLKLMQQGWKAGGRKSICVCGVFAYVFVGLMGVCICEAVGTIYVCTEEKPLWDRTDTYKIFTNIDLSQPRSMTYQTDMPLARARVFYLEKDVLHVLLRVGLPPPVMLVLVL